tara:strand:+ start:6268 stop:6507 length:240 start_codon:yes stop_codon:yes gene_type:complete
MEHKKIIKLADKHRPVFKKVLLDSDAVDFKYNHRQDHSTNFERWQLINDHQRDRIDFERLSGEEQLNKFVKMYGHFDED